MKILIYGFEPYKDFKKNISQEVINKVPAERNLVKVVFPVKFDEQIFLKKMQNRKPDVIIGLGQHPRARKIRIERKAVNLKGSRKDGYRPISKNDSRYRFVNLRLKEDDHSYISYNAGRFVCNFSMYILSKWNEENNVKFAFIHIPKDFDTDLATHFIKSKIDAVKNEG